MTGCEILLRHAMACLTGDRVSPNQDMYDDFEQIKIKMDTGLSIIKKDCLLNSFIMAHIALTAKVDNARRISLIDKVFGYANQCLSDIEAACILKFLLQNPYNLTIRMKEMATWKEYGPKNRWLLDDSHDKTMQMKAMYDNMKREEANTALVVMHNEKEVLIGTFL